jgi:hypothetical protein
MEGKIVLTEISCKIQEIAEARHYKGQLIIGGSTLDFDLRLAGSLSLLSKRDPIADIGIARNIFALTLSKNAFAIKLSDKEYHFFLEVLCPFSAACHVKLLFVRLANQFSAVNGICLIPREFGRNTIVDVEAGGIWVRGEYDLSSEVQTILKDPKFGCNLLRAKA